jgi:hypothetical protein
MLGRGGETDGVRQPKAWALAKGGVEIPPQHHHHHHYYQQVFVGLSRDEFLPKA